MKKSAAAILFFSIIFITTLNAGSSPAFIKYSMTAQDIGRGFTYIAADNSISNIAGNPGALSITPFRQKYVSLYLGNGIVYSGLNNNLNSMFFMYPTINYGTFGMAVSNLNSIKLEQRSTPDRILGYFSDNNYVFYAAYSKNIFNTIGAGFNIKAIRTSIAQYTATAFGADVGIAYKFEDKINIGGCISNIIMPKMQLNAVEENYMPSYGIGVLYKINQKNINLSLDLKKEAGETLKYRIGIEAQPYYQFAVRAGLLNEKATAGLSLIFGHWTIDSAFTYDRLGLSMFFGINVKFGNNFVTRMAKYRAGMYIEQGKQFLADSNIDSAVALFELAYDLAPLSAEPKQALAAANKEKINFELYKKGTNYFNKGDYGRAQEYLKKYLIDGGYAKQKANSYIDKSKDYQKAKELYETARQKYILGEYAAAKNLIKYSVRLNPSDTDAVRLSNNIDLIMSIGRVFAQAQDDFDSGDYAGAIALSEKVLRIRPDYSAAKILKEKAKIMQIKNTLIKQYNEALAGLDFSAAVKAVNIMLNFAPNDEKLIEKLHNTIAAEKFYKQGMLYFEKGLYQKAYFRFAAAKKLVPYNEKIEGLLKISKNHIAFEDIIAKARKLSAAKKYEDALKLYEKALLLVPGAESIQNEYTETKVKYYKKLYKTLGAEHFAKNEWQDAKEQYQNYLMYDPENIEVKDRIRIADMRLTAQKLKDEGQKAFKEQDYETAKKKFQNAISLFKDDTAAKVLLEEAIKKQNEDFHLNLLKSHLKNKDWVNAYVEVKKVLEINPADTFASAKISIIEKELKQKELLDKIAGLNDTDFKAKERALLQLTKLFPENQKYNDLLAKTISDERYYTKKREGIVYFDSGDYNKALTVFTSLSSARPDDNEVQKYAKESEKRIEYAKQLKRAESYEKDSNPESAVLHYKKAYALVPSENLYNKVLSAEKEISIREFLKNAEKAYIIGDYEKAKQQADKALALNPDLRKALGLKNKVDKKEKIFNLVRKANEYKKQSKYSSAISVYKNILKIDPNNREITGQLISAQRKYKAQGLYDSGVRVYIALNNRRAEEYFKKALSIDSGLTDAADYLDKVRKNIDIEKYLMKGKQKFLLLDDTGAIADFNKVLELDSGNLEALKYKEKIKQLRHKKQKLAEAKQLIREADLNSAIKILKELKSEFPSDDKINSLLNQTISLKQDTIRRSSIKIP